MIARIQQTVDSEPGLSRRGLSRRVCEWLNWRSWDGKLKAMSGRVALLSLERRGEIRLPKAARFPAPRTTTVGERKEKGPEAEKAEVAGRLRQVEPIELIAVHSSDSEVSRVWMQLMKQYHPLGAGPLCGAQMRYLIRSERYGWLGGLAFSAAAWQLKARDSWIGWSGAARRQNLNRVVANSRLLILPHVRIRDLASHVLGQALRRLRQDWKQRYGYEPLLVETFVDPAHKGTCYRAANWNEIGQTAGRGRQDRANKPAISKKRIFVYKLHRQARQLLCAAETEPEPERSPKPEPKDWAEGEFGGAPLGDQRLSERLLVMARDFYARPQAQIPQACQSRAKTKAAYRFLEHPDTTMDRLLEPHVESTCERLRDQDIVLAVQDTTSLNYSAHPATEDLGPIGSQLEGPIGLLVHDTMAFTAEGTPLGLLDVQCWSRDGSEFGKRHQRRQRRIEEKESHKWLESFSRVAEAQQRCPNTILVSVGDREADIYELFHLALEDPKGPKLLVRAEQDRLLADGQGHLWAAVEQQPVAGIQEILVPRRGKNPARQARLEIRFAEVVLKPPKGKSHYGRLKIWAVLAQEVEAPQGIQPLSWMLLTTCPVATFQEAIEKLDWYTKRWCIEIYHRTLKSGCQIEERQLRHADRIEACLAIDMVVAWRVYHLVKLGREVPDVPCTVFFEEAEWKAITAYITKNPIPPAEPPRLREVTRMVATLGGFLGRKSDGEPGTKSLWLGLQRLDDIKETWKFMVIHFAPHLLSPPVSRAPTYG